MSLELYHYRPSTPPSMPASGYLTVSRNNHNYIHARADSSSSNNSTPESGISNLTTPNRSPVLRQHGPALLPRIRPQDLTVEPVSCSGPIRALKTSLNVRKPPGFVPYPANRSQARLFLASLIDCSTVSPISASSVVGNRGPSTLSSPVTLTPSHSRRLSGRSHSRSTSTSSIDESIWGRYAYPTYRNVPRYVSQYSPTAPVSATSHLSMSYPPFNDQAAPQLEPSPLPLPSYPYLESPVTSVSSLLPAPALISTPPYSDSGDLELSTTLLKYLTEPTQAINLVSKVRVPLGRGQQQHFWWDIRNLRNWTSFSLSTIHSIPNLTELLTTQVSQDTHPLSTVSPSRLFPSSEGSLSELIRDIYAPRVNAALQTSLGKDFCLHLKPTPEAFLTGNRSKSGPHFIANYNTDTAQTSSGAKRGRLVGLVKSFDCWNSGMRNQQPHKRVEYLNGLAHLQRCMRDHSCRYGFIMTEIELVCVRAGCDEGDNVPYFGYLEVAAPIPTNLSSETYSPPSPHNLNTNMDRSHSATSTQSSSHSPSPSPPPLSSSHSRSTSPSSPSHKTPLTATLALYFLLFLSKSEPLPTQPSWYLNVGGSGVLPRQHVLPEGKDKWIPDPQTGEKRDAKRVRGWVWPQDPWHRREGGGASRVKAQAHAQAQLQLRIQQQSQQDQVAWAGAGGRKKWHK
ncbi:hypothetical protein GX48_00394 [Paracoccidioides brasiliensis]|nr:hypothetical protein GX48_00394 [Paracoccidioides brasiliensis]